MKKVFLVFAILFSIAAKSQDSTQAIITVTLPVKALVLYGAYLSESPAWAERKAPDYLISKIGSGNLPDSLVSVVIKSDQLATFIIRLQSERYGAVNTAYKSIMNNVPSIEGYTALTAQVTTKANGNTSEKKAAQHIIAKYNSYTATMDALYTEWYNKGLEFIRN